MTSTDQIAKASELLFTELDNFESLLSIFNNEDKIKMYKAFDLAVQHYSVNQNESVKIFKTSCGQENLPMINEFMDIVMITSAKLNLIYHLDYHKA